MGRMETLESFEAQAQNWHDITSTVILLAKVSHMAKLRFKGRETRLCFLVGGAAGHLAKGCSYQEGRTGTTLANC